ncbi:ectoine synthase [Trichocoleus sp. DQ-U1]|uniref:ectoine synthase n=1 Tax=Trichocoleus sp. DQ-U1 TaxID=2933926 RepID=UPI0032982B2C
MIIRTLNEIINTERDIEWGNGQSRRFLLARDGMKFSLTDTLIEANTESLLEYRNHMEACYCVEGEGEVEVDGKIYPIQPGTMYALDKNDKHYLRAKTTLRLICVFTPSLQGHESHQLSNSKSSCY